MKILKKLLLINWHYFTHEKIEFEQLNFMTGVNASGKSTIIDALQLVLLGDTSGAYFNKSASGKSSRTLISYLCGEIRDDDKDGFKYLRNSRFTSYIAVEFYDNVKNKYFTFGCCFDVYSVNDFSRRFFKYNGQIPDNDFLQNQVPLGIALLREYLNNNYDNISFYDTGVSYREEVYAMLGGLRDKFAILLKKAVSFNPDSNIQKFISEFVCDSEKTVDVSIMQENIRNYKSLEKSAEELAEKKNSLEIISREFNEFKRNKENEKLYKYLIDKSNIKICKENISEFRKKAEECRRNITLINENFQKEKIRGEELQKEYEQLLIQRDNDKSGRELDDINRKISELQQKLTEIRKEFDKTVSNIFKISTDFTKATNTFYNKHNSISLESTDIVIVSMVDNLLELTDRLSQKYEALENISPDSIMQFSYEGFNNIIDLIKNVKSVADKLYSRLNEEQKSIDDNLKNLEAEKQNLEKGIFKFPQNSIDLKNTVISEIKAKTGQTPEVVIVAEASEIKNDRWRNAIEGYMNTQKFYIIVPPQYIRIAVKVFDRIKRVKSIYDTGIVDVEKLKSKNYKADRNSLASEIETKNPYVRIYLDYILGRVMKCDNVEEIRNNRVSITDEGLLYKNFVVRAINPITWKNPAIGQNAIKKRLQTVIAEMALEREKQFVCSTLKIGAQGFEAVENYSKTDVERFVDSAENMVKSKEYELQIGQLEEKKNSLDTSNFILLNELVNEKKAELDQSHESLNNYGKRLGGEEEKLRKYSEETIPNAENELMKKESKLSLNFDKEWIETVGDLRYMQEISKRMTAQNISEAFPRELSRSINAVQRLYQTVVELRSQYNHNYKMGYDVKSYENTEYDNALKEIEENQLPEYINRIEDTRKKTMEEFQEEFLSKLFGNIRAVQAQIKELNYAISSASFGEDTYRFKIEPNPEYRRYYDMITDEMLLLGGYNLMSYQFNEKYKNEIEELFSIITGEGNTSLDQSDYEKRIRTFTDYRTYLSFDIEVENKEGEIQRLSKTIGKKSGGETQTPFYIAVLASFAQLYRIGRDKKANTAKLIIFDEAFSKMDGERIEKSISLLRKLGFQVILSTPTEKAGDIAPKVDRVLLVLRKGKNSRVVNFDKEHIGELNYD